MHCCCCKHIVDDAFSAESRYGIEMTLVWNLDDSSMELE